MILSILVQLCGFFLYLDDKFGSYILFQLVKLKLYKVNGHYF